MSTRTALSFALLAAFCVPAKLAYSQSEPTIQPFGSEMTGTLCVSWLREVKNDGTSKDYVLAGGLDRVVRKYLIPPKISKDALPKLEDTYVESFEKQTMTERAASILSLAIDKNGERFATGSSDFEARVWSIKHESEVQFPQVPNISLRRTVSDSSGNYFAAVFDKEVRIWKTADLFGASIRIPLENLNSFHFQVIAPYSVVAGSPDGKLVLTDFPLDPNQRKERVIETPDLQSSSARIVADGQNKIVWTLDSQGNLRQWSCGDLNVGWEPPNELTDAKTGDWAMSGSGDVLYSSRVNLATLEKITQWKVSANGEFKKVADMDGLALPRTLVTNRKGNLAAFAINVGNEVHIQVVGPTSNALNPRLDIQPPAEDFGSVECLAISSDGGLLAACDDVGKLYIHSIPESLPEFEIENEEDRVTWKYIGDLEDTRVLMKFLGDKRCIVAGGATGHVQIWDCSKVRRGVQNVTGKITALDVAPNGQGYQVVVGFCPTIGSPDPSIASIQVQIAPNNDATFGLPDNLKLPWSETVASVAFSGDSTRLVTTSNEGRLALFAVHETSLKPIEYRTQPEMPISDRRRAGWLLDDRRTVLSAQDDKLLRPWKSASTGESVLASTIQRPIRPLSIDPPSAMPPKNGRLLFAAAGNDAVVRNFHFGANPPSTISEEKPPLEDKNNPGAVRHAAKGSKGLVIVGSESGTVSLFDAETGEVKQSVHLSGSINGFSESQKHQGLIAAALGDSSYAILDFSDPSLPAFVDQHRYPKSANRVVKAVTFLPDLNGGLLAVGFEKDKFAIRKLSPEAILGNLNPNRIETKTCRNYHSGPVYGVAWDDDGQQLATASADGCVRVWSVADKTVIDCKIHPSKEDVKPQDVPINGPPFGELWILPREKWGDSQPPWNQRVVYSAAFRKLNTKTGIFAQSVGTHVDYWEISSPNPDHSKASLEQDEKLLSMKLSVDANWLAAGTSKGHVALWELEPNTGVPKPNMVILNVGNNRKAAVFALGFTTHASKQRLAALNEAGDLLVWDNPPTWTEHPPIPPLNTASGNGHSFSSLAWNQDGDRLVAGSMPTSPVARTLWLVKVD